jgi:hypothetical protein
MAILTGAGLRHPKVPGASDLKRPLLASRTTEPAAGAPQAQTEPEPKKRRNASATPRAKRSSPRPRRSRAAAPPADAVVATSPRRRGNAQTVLSLPSETWDAIDTCAIQAGTRPGALLAELVRQRGPETPGEAGRLLSEFLASGQPIGAKEDRNIRLPVQTRNRLDGHRDALRAAGLHEATRSALLLALWVTRGPKSAQDARDLLNAGRLAALEQLQ